jgi:hypothetical protein
VRSIGRAVRVATCSTLLIAAAIASAGWGRAAPAEVGSAPTKSAARWTTVSRTPFPRKRAGAVVDPNGTVYVIGGADGYGYATAQKCTRCGAG